MSRQSLRTCPRKRVTSLMAAIGVPAALMMALPGGAHAQQDDADHWVSISVEPMAVLRVTGAGAASFTIRDPSTPGAAPVIQTEDQPNRYLQFTSIVSAPGATRRITASHNGEVPDGLVLRLRMWDGLDGPGGVGALGTSGDGSSWQNTNLTELDQDVIWNIGSGYTGTGANDGWWFTYDLAVSNQVDPHAFWSSLTAQTASVQIFFTLTEEEGGAS